MPVKAQNLSRTDSNLKSERVTTGVADVFMSLAEQMLRRCVRFSVKTAAVIGAGIGGIATAIRLAARGYSVSVFEAADGPGGKLSEFKLGDYRFDFGPSLFTLPSLVDDLFRLTGRDPGMYFTYSKLEIACRYFYPDETRINAYTDAHRFAEEIENKLGVSRDIIHNYLAHSRKISEHTTPIFLESSLHKLSTFLRKDTIKAIVKMPGFDMHMSMHEANKRRLGDPKLVQLFDRFATYNGSNPYKAPGILNVIPSLEHLDGAFLPHGGMYAITQSLYRLAEDLGVQFQFKTPVVRIDVQNGSATGVITAHGRYSADLVVSNMDISLTYKHLIPAARAPHRILDQERSSSAVVFYWGVDRTFEELDVHNIFFSADYEQEFKHIFDYGKVSDDPTVYVNVTSKKVKGDAPEGCENWFVMINAPHDNGQDWKTIVAATRRNVIMKLNAHLHTDIEDHIVEEDVTDPVRIWAQTRSLKGALYGSSSNDRMAAFLRHPNFSRQIDNLYFCGGSVHPGGGIPLCLLSAKIIDDLVA